MENYIMMAVAMFIFSTASFVNYYLKETKDRDNLELFLQLMFSFIASMFWFVSIPVALIMGFAWLLAQFVIKMVKSRE